LNIGLDYDDLIR